MKKKLIMAAAAAVLLCMVFSCKPAEPPINITFGTFLETVEKKDWENGANFNALNSSESAKFRTDFAAQEIWKKTEGAETFSVEHKDHEDFVLVQEKDGAWKSIYMTIETELRKGDDPWRVPLMVSDFNEVVGGRLWNSAVNFNTMNASALRKLDADIFETSWKRDQTSECFSIVHDEHKDFTITQKADGKWISIYGGVETALTDNGQDPFVKPVEFSNFISIVDAKSWPSKPNFNGMTQSEKEVFAEKCNASELWKMAEGTDGFAVSSKDGKTVIHQDPDGTWWKEVDGRKGLLVEGEAHSTLPIAYDDFTEVVAGKKWTADIKFSSMDALEKSEFMNEAEAAGWTVSFSDAENGIELFNALWKPDAKYRVYQREDGTWYSGAESSHFGIVTMALVTDSDPVFDADEKIYDELYEFDGARGTITAWKGGDSYKSVYIPAEMNGKPVTAIGNDVFKDNAVIESIDLPSSLKSIGENAFHNCTALKNIELPAGLESLGSTAFWNTTGISSITIPAGVAMDGGAFMYWTPEQTITVPAGLKLAETEPVSWLMHSKARVVWEGTESNGFIMGADIYGNFAILGADGTATELVIPENMTFKGFPVMTVNAKAFSDNDKIKTIEINDTDIMLMYDVFSGWTADQKIIIGKGVDTAEWESAWRNGSAATVDNRNLYDGKYYCLPTEDGTGFRLQGVVGDDTGELSIPPVIDGQSVKEIGPDAFKWSSFTKIVLPEGLTSIGKEAFFHTNKLQEIVLPSTLKRIEESAFLRKSFDENAACTVTIPESVEYVGPYAFQDWQGNSKIYVESGAPIDKWDKLWLSGCEAKIFENAGTGSSWGISILPDDTVEITAFDAKPEDKDIVIPEELVGHTVTKIRSYAFQNLSSMESVTIPKTVTAIGENPFLGCSSLKSITVAPENTKYRAEKGCLIDIDGKTLVSAASSAPDFEMPSDGTVTNIGKDAVKGFNMPIFSISAPVKEVANPKWFLEFGTGVEEIRIAAGSTVTFKDVLNDYGNIPMLLFENWVAGNQYGWRDVSDGIMITCASPDPDGKVVIPAEINGKKVVAVRPNCLRSVTGITEIKVEHGVERIGTLWLPDDNAGLKFISLPNTLTEFGSALYGRGEAVCVMEAGWDDTGKEWYGGKPLFNYHEGHVELGIIENDGSFTMTGLLDPGTDAVIPAEAVGHPVKKIEAGLGSALSKSRTIYISDGVEVIGKDFFERAYGKTDVYIPSTVKSLEGQNLGHIGVIHTDHTAESWKTLGASAGKVVFDSIWGTDLRGRPDTDGKGFVITGTVRDVRELAIPETITDTKSGKTYTVTAIGESAFKEWGGSMTLPETLKRIEDYAFIRADFRTPLTVPASVEYVGDHGLYSLSTSADIYYRGTYEDTKNFHPQWRSFDGRNAYPGYFGDPNIFGEKLTDGTFRLTGYKYDSPVVEIPSEVTMNGENLTVSVLGPEAIMAVKKGSWLIPVSEIIIPETVKEIQKGMITSLVANYYNYQDGLELYPVVRIPATVEKMDEILKSEFRTGVYLEHTSAKIEEMKAAGKFVPCNMRDCHADLITGSDWCGILDADGKWILTRYAGNESFVTVPAEINGKSVKELRGTFDMNVYGHSYEFIDTVVVSEGITDIGENSFSNMSYNGGSKHIWLPSTVTKVHSTAFGSDSGSELQLQGTKSGLADMEGGTLNLGSITVIENAPKPEAPKQ